MSDHFDHDDETSGGTEDRPGGVARPETAVPLTRTPRAAVQRRTQVMADLCSVEGCDRPTRTRGWCGAHYSRWKRTRDVRPEATIAPLPPTAPPGATPAERFQLKVDKGGPTPEHRPDLGSCWLWTAALDRDGYGQFTVNRRQVVAHRWSYTAAIGPIPEGLHLDHLCRVRSCVNPTHLEPVTCRENLMRGDTPNARYASRTACDQGHPYDEANTRLRSGGGRLCRACDRERNRERMRAVRAKGGAA